MSSKVGRKDIAKALYCSSLMEKKVARAYESLSEKVGDFVVKKLLLSISTDSIKHSMLLNALGEIVMKLDVNEELCKAQMGEAWNSIEEMAEEETRREDINGDITSLISKMTSLESFMGEEHFTALHLQLINLMGEEAGIEFDQIKTMIEWIIVDEDRHEKIVQMIYRRVRRMS